MAKKIHSYTRMTPVNISLVPLQEKKRRKVQGMHTNLFFENMKTTFTFLFDEFNSGQCVENGNEYIKER